MLLAVLVRLTNTVMSSASSATVTSAAMRRNTDRQQRVQKEWKSPNTHITSENTPRMMRPLHPKRLDVGARRHVCHRRHQHRRCFARWRSAYTGSADFGGFCMTQAQMMKPIPISPAKAEYVLRAHFNAEDVS